MATIASSLFSLPSLRVANKPYKITTLLPCPNFLQPNLTLKFSRLGISYTNRNGSKQVLPVVISCLVEDNSIAEGSESNPGWKRWEDIGPCLRGEEDEQRFEDIFFNETSSKKQTVCRAKRLRDTDIRGQKRFF
ncbi:hypothetical protein HanOQP8_Chr12g0448581 [Helianthus annuus]|nr:hypothetical protein HanOQP8_Chr12g0448581 [Helianthus annuus]